MTKYIFTLFILLGHVTLFAQTTTPAQRYIQRMLEEKIRYKPGYQAVQLQEDEAAQLQKTQAIDTRISTTTGAEEEGEAFIMINPADSNNLVVSYMNNDANASTLLTFPIYYSHDGGATWAKSTFDCSTISTSDYPGEQVAGGGDPVFAFDATGKLYFSWIYLMLSPSFAGDMAMNWAYSNDGGATFQASPTHFIGRGDLNVFTGQTGTTFDGVFDRQWMAVDRSGGAHNGRLYTSCVFFPNTTTTLAGNGMVVKYKEPGVDSFAYVNLPILNTENAQLSNLAVDKMGYIHVTFGDLVDMSVNHAISQDGGLTFTKNVVYANGKNLWTVGKPHDRANAAISLAVNDAHVYVAWCDSADNQGLKGYFRHSPDRGVTWDAIYELGNITNASAKQMMPTVTVNETGRVSVSWFNLSQDIKIGHYVAAFSNDNGMTWTPAVQISSDPTDFTNFPPGQGFTPGKFFGDYMNSVSHNNNTHIVWSDGRNGTTPKMYYSKVDNTGTSVGISEATPITDKISLQNLYPNPVVNEVINVELLTKEAMKVSAELFSLEGKKVHSLLEETQIMGKTNLQIPVKAIASGTYMLVINTPYGFISRKVMIE